MQNIKGQVKVSCMGELLSMYVVWNEHFISYEIWDVYNNRYNICKTKMYDNQHKVYMIAQINSKL